MVQPQQAPSGGVPELTFGRDALIRAITGFLAAQHAETLPAIREALEREIEAAGPEALAELDRRLTSPCVDWGYYPPDPLARRIHHVLAERVLEGGSVLSGVEHVTVVADKRVVMFSNHLSYSDANLLEVLLGRAGGRALSDRLTAIAGPKVYSSLRRRFSSLCFGTIKVPQSSTRATEDAVMDARVAAHAARRAIEIAHERLRLGEALLVFAEGARSRTGAMQQLLTGASRYLDCPDTWILPVGIVGTEAMFPIGDETLYPVRILARVGPPIEARLLRDRAQGNRRLMMDVVGLAIASLLPPEYRGAYADTVL